MVGLYAMRARIRRHEQPTDEGAETRATESEPRKTEHIARPSTARGAPGAVYGRHPSIPCSGAPSTGPCPGPYAAQMAAPAGYARGGGAHAGRWALASAASTRGGSHPADLDDHHRNHRQ